MEGDNQRTRCFFPIISPQIHDFRDWITINFIGVDPHPIFFRRGCKSTLEDGIIPRELVEETNGEMVEEAKVGKGKDKESGIIECLSGEGACAICLDEIPLQEIALVKGCEHAYCVTCILKWATYSKNQTCPQCLNPFKSIQTHRSLDGSIHDYMLEESVCLLLRAVWFKPEAVEAPEEVEDMCYYYPLEEDDEEEEMGGRYMIGSSSIRIGNRRWGDNGYVRAGRQEARPAVARGNPSGSGSCPSAGKGAKKGGGRGGGGIGRRAMRAMKRLAASDIDGPVQAPNDAQ